MLANSYSFRCSEMLKFYLNLTDIIVLIFYIVALLEKERKKLDSENFNVDNWIKRRKLGNLNSCNSDIPNENYSEKEHDTTPLTLPPLLQNIANLPISLLPCPALPEDFKPDQWG